MNQENFVKNGYSCTKQITEKRLKWYLRRMKEKHIVRRMLDVDIPGK